MLKQLSKNQTNNNKTIVYKLSAITIFGKCLLLSSLLFLFTFTSLIISSEKKSRQGNEEMQKWKKDARKRKEVEKKKLDVKQQKNRWGKKILKFITLFPLDTLLDNLGCRYMTGMTLPSKWSCFTINIIILFTFVSLKVVGYIVTRQFLERLPNKKKTII